MTFEEKYPELEINGIILFEGDEYVKSAEVNLCWNCNRETRFYSVSFMFAPLCSERCATEKWNEYWEATKVY